MHGVIFYFVHPNGQKSTGADMQGHVGQSRTTSRNAIQHRLVEVQSRSRRSNGTRIACINGLIPCEIFDNGRPFDIRRQRHLSQPVQHGQYLVAELQQEEIPLPLDHHG